MWISGLLLVYHPTCNKIRWGLKTGNALRNVFVKSFLCLPHLSLWLSLWWGRQNGNKSVGTMMSWKAIPELEKTCLAAETLPELTCSSKQTFKATCEVWVTQSGWSQRRAWAHSVGSWTFLLFLFKPSLPVLSIYACLSQFIHFFSAIVCVSACYSFFLTCLYYGCPSIIISRKGCVSVV